MAEPPPTISIESEPPEEEDVNSVVESILQEYGGVADEWREFLGTIRTTDDADERRAVIGKYMNIRGYEDDLQAGILLEYYAGIIEYCLSCVLTSDQSLVLFNIGRDVLQSATTHNLTLAQSTAEFKGRVLRRATGSSSDCIFSEDQAKSIADYFASTLYQHYNLYLQVFANEQDVEAREMHVDIQCAMVPPPLSEAVTNEEYEAMCQAKRAAKQEEERQRHDAEMARLAAEHEAEDAMYRAAAEARLRERQQAQLLDQVVSSLPGEVPDLDAEGWAAMREVAGAAGDVVQAKIAELRDFIIEKQNDQYREIEQHLDALESSMATARRGGESARKIGKKK